MRRRPFVEPGRSGATAGPHRTGPRRKRRSARAAAPVTCMLWSPPRYWVPRDRAGQGPTPLGTGAWVSLPRGRDESAAGRCSRRGSVSAPGRCASGGTESSTGTGRAAVAVPAPCPVSLQERIQDRARVQGLRNAPMNPEVKRPRRNPWPRDRNPWPRETQPLAPRNATHSLAVEQPRPGQASPLVLALPLRVVEPLPVRLQELSPAWVLAHVAGRDGAV